MLLVDCIEDEQSSTSKTVHGHCIAILQCYYIGCRPPATSRIKLSPEMFGHVQYYAVRLHAESVVSVAIGVTVGLPFTVTCASIVGVGVGVNFVVGVDVGASMCFCDTIYVFVAVADDCSAGAVRTRTCRSRCFFADDGPLPAVIAVDDPDAGLGLRYNAVALRKAGAFNKRFSRGTCHDTYVMMWVIRWEVSRPPTQIVLSVLLG